MTGDLQLRFPDEATAKSVLAVFTRTETIPHPSDPKAEPTRIVHWVTGSHDHALDAIGPVQLTPERRDAAFKVIEAATWDTGYHVNLRLLTEHKLPDLSAYLVTPKSPKRVWG